jgi:hypothetical protein
MSNQQTNSANGNHSYLLTISYNDRELPCYVDWIDDRLNVTIGDDLQAVLQIEADGDLEQVSGNKLPESTISFLKKEILQKPVPQSNDQQSTEDNTEQ